MFKRSSGVLAHVTSLPSPHGVGTMGKTARDFVDFLARAGQRVWQILPLSPTGFGNSPYQSFFSSIFRLSFRSVIPASAIRRTSAFRQRQAIRI